MERGRERGEGRVEGGGAGVTETEAAQEGGCGCGRGRLKVGLNGGPEARTGTMPFGAFPFAPNCTYFQSLPDDLEQRKLGRSRLSFKMSFLLKSHSKSNTSPLEHLPFVIHCAQ